MSDDTLTPEELAHCKAAVSRGCDLLDKHRPGWRDEVRGKTIQMSRCEECVLGHLYGDYARGLSELECRADHHGFNAPSHTERDLQRWSAVIAGLGREWLKAIGDCQEPLIVPCPKGEPQP